MVYLLYFADRLRPSSRWLFWRSNHACVSAWIDVADVATAKAKAEDKAKRKGWRIIRYDRAVLVGDDKLPLDWWVFRFRIGHARRAGAHYEFYPASPSGGCMMWEPDVDGDESNGTGPAETWNINPEAVPASLRSALELGAKWAISDDVMRSRALRRASTQEMQKVVAAVTPLQVDIEKWCDARRNAVPVPDEVTLFDRLLEAVTEMEAAIRIAERRGEDENRQ